MTLAEYKEYMKDFFEKYYEKLSRDDINIERPLNEKNREMWADDADPNEEWKKWKLVPADIDESEIAEFEQEIGIELPLSVKAFLTTYFHFFEEPIGVNPFSNPTILFKMLMPKFSRQIWISSRFNAMFHWKVTAVSICRTLFAERLMANSWYVSALIESY